MACGVKVVWGGDNGDDVEDDTDDAAMERETEEGGVAVVLRVRGGFDRGCMKDVDPGQGDGVIVDQNTAISQVERQRPTISVLGEWGQGVDKRRSMELSGDRGSQAMW